MDKSATVDRDKMSVAVMAVVALALSRGKKVRFDISDDVLELRVDGLPADFSERVTESLSEQFGLEVELVNGL